VRMGTRLDRVTATNADDAVKSDEAFMVSIKAAISSAEVIKQKHVDEKLVSGIYMNASECAEHAATLLAELPKPRKKYAALVQELRVLTDVVEVMRNRPFRLHNATSRLETLVTAK